MKRLIFAVFSTVSLLTLSGCGEQYPTVEVHNGPWKSYITIDIGKQYVYKDFDVEETDGGKDLILHFMEDEK